MTKTPLTTQEVQNQITAQLRAGAQQLPMAQYKQEIIQQLVDPQDPTVQLHQVAQQQPIAQLPHEAQQQPAIHLHHGAQQQPAAQLLQGILPQGIQQKPTVQQHHVAHQQPPAQYQQEAQQQPAAQLYHGPYQQSTTSIHQGAFLQHSVQLNQSLYQQSPPVSIFILKLIYCCSDKHMPKKTHATCQCTCNFCPYFEHLDFCLCIINVLSHIIFY